LVWLGTVARDSGSRSRCRSHALDALEIAKLLRHVESPLGVDTAVGIAAIALLKWADSSEHLGRGQQ
jgi:hypothetical protein